jgi:hypothetical protein
VKDNSKWRNYVRVQQTNQRADDEDEAARERRERERAELD